MTSKHDKGKKKKTMEGKDMIIDIDIRIERKREKMKKPYNNEKEEGEEVIR